VPEVNAAVEQLANCYYCHGSFSFYGAQMCTNQLSVSSGCLIHLVPDPNRLISQD
jgi:hypothetical protein